MDAFLQRLTAILDLGGPVVAVLIATSVATMALILYKLWQYKAAGVGRHVELSLAIEAWDRNDRATARAHLDRSRSYLAPVVAMALDGHGPELMDRADAEAEARFAGLERGLNVLDMVSQLAPLLGLFGTVLGMIEAFRTLQEAGNAVDPALLAGGIWVALMTTAAGLAVAMPTSLVLTWFEARMTRERVFTNRALRTVFAPGHAAAPRPAIPSSEALAHGA
ncbi:MotA/TolQ/ExbB proton channel family protein [Ruegeria sp. HKCCD6228]|uniref:MotA/TolQ/ExbB proton channel family protein n=1 Tax=Ruegeria atlantica TaxID=81569 RepID=A0ABX1WD04_9RHOB|nr:MULTISPECIES: MotA/TolQ/ExbB proton channel family protein [Ruegeria]NOD31141.1 MotA/TolQ/ExbB proton channel family protein [Ruegeria atlantica]NOD97534.1 MotA/TolQ/ExbB proton channel family protein [Ruegeria sp. HKCCD6228]